MSDVPSAPLPSIRRAQAIEDLRRAFLVRFADPYSTPSILTNVLFENAKHATQPEDGLTREELLDLANAYLERITDGLRTIAEDELTRDIPRIAKRVREFAAYLPLYRYGVRSMSGPTHEARGDSIRRLWLRIDLTEATRTFDVGSPETTGARDMDHMHADLVVELVAVFTARYIDQHWLELGTRTSANRLFYELLHICAREARHRRGIAAITASTIELNALWQNIRQSTTEHNESTDRVGSELATLARRLRAITPWTRRVPVDSGLFYDGELSWNYVETHGGRFEMQWRFWHVFHGKRGMELTTPDDLRVARSISQIPLVQPAVVEGSADPNGDPVITSLAQAMVARLAERKDSRTILFLHALEDLGIKIVALLRRKRDVREAERTEDIVVLRQHEEVVLGVAASEMTVTDGALARTVLGGSIAPAQEHREPTLHLVDDDELAGSDDERERTIAYFNAVDKTAGGRLGVLLDHMLPVAALDAQFEKTNLLRSLVRAAAANACNELAAIGVIASPMTFFFARYLEIIDEWRVEEADADMGGPEPDIEVLRRTRLERLGLPDMLYRRATSVSPTMARLAGAAALAAAGRAVVRFMRLTDPIEFSLARSLEGDLRVVARILERYRQTPLEPPSS
jgi:hypothetical protein